MQVGPIKKLKAQLATLIPQTKTCKICFRKIKQNSLNSIIKPQYFICDDCFRKLKLKLQSFKIDTVKCYCLYEYDEWMKKLIYQFKGCYDYELKDVFLERFSDILTLKYRNYIIIPAPSFKDDDAKRGFNHVEEIFQALKLPIIKCIHKLEKVKQSDRSFEERKCIIDYLNLDESVDLTDKNVLFVDDIFTTGSTLRACVSLIQKLKPAKIEALVLCKTRDLENR